MPRIKKAAKLGSVGADAFKRLEECDSKKGADAEGRDLLKNQIDMYLIGAIATRGAI